MANKKVESVIHADGVDIAVVTTVGSEEDYISLTDIAKHRNPDFPADVVKNWLRLRSTIEFLGLWEQLNNPQFNMVDFDQFKNDAGSNAFVMSPQKWIKSTNAIGLISKSGRYGGGTYTRRSRKHETSCRNYTGSNQKSRTGITSVRLSFVCRCRFCVGFSKKFAFRRFCQML